MIISPFIVNLLRRITFGLVEIRAKILSARPTGRAVRIHRSQVYISRRYPMWARIPLPGFVGRILYARARIRINQIGRQRMRTNRVGKLEEEKKLMLFELSNANTTFNNRVFPKKKNDRTQVADRHD